jgi:hypothetical protein
MLRSIRPAVVEPPLAKMLPPPPTARERRGGTVGVGYLGLSSMQPIVSLGGLGGLGLAVPRSQVPLLGVRWWFKNARIGLDAGLGAMTSSLESNQFASIPSVHVVGHVGLPIAIASTQHVIVLLAPWIVGAFTSDTAVARVATLGLRIIGLGFPLYAFGMVMTQSFNGAGDTWTPTWINVFVFWLFEIPLAWALSKYTSFGYVGGFVAITIAYCALAITSAFLFRRGTWKTKRV